jgi:hypothetical protein
MLSDNELNNLDQCLELLHKDPDTLTEEEKENLLEWLGEDSPLDSYLELDSWFQAVVDKFRPEFREEERPPVVQRLEEMCEANSPEQTEPSQLVVRLVDRYVRENPSAPDKLKVWLRRLPVVPIDFVLYHEGKEIEQIHLDATQQEIEITISEAGSYQIVTQDGQLRWQRQVIANEMLLSHRDMEHLEKIGAAAATTELENEDFTSWKDVVIADRLNISLIRDIDCAILHIERPIF